jgi:YrbI family 3-deoxy-D-manno-octulosonate 8-phosphate phosphatase
MRIAFIPIRCQSKSIKLKNIKSFCGKPLVYWSLKALEDSETIDVIYVASDCDEIISTVLTFDFSKVRIFYRNNTNASDTASSESVMIEFIDKNNFKKDDIFFLVQATSPFTQPKDFDKAFQSFSSENADSLLTCVRNKRFFWTEDYKPLNYNLLSRPRRQDFNGILMENGAFYINSVSNILKYKNRLSGKIIVHEMDEFTGVELDEEDDWIIAERLMYKYILNCFKVSDIKLFLSDVDGTLTDAGMYYGQNGEEFKKFNTHDGKGFELLRKANIKTGLITSEKTAIVTRRAKKLKVDYLFQGVENQGKLDVVKEICLNEGISLENVAYIGDDINCLQLLKNVGFAACPNDALNIVKNDLNVTNMTKNGGEGVVREFINKILKL